MHIHTRYNNHTNTNASNNARVYIINAHTHQWRMYAYILYTLLRMLQHIDKLGEPRKQLSGMTKTKKKKRDELKNLISEVVKFSVQICSKIRQISFSL